MINNMGALSGICLIAHIILYLCNQNAINEMYNSHKQEKKGFADMYLSINFMGNRKIVI
mgnify:CR=1 FL=1